MGTATERSVPAIGMVELLLWVVFSVTPFLFVAGYLLDIHKSDPAPEPRSVVHVDTVRPTSKPPQFQSTIVTPPIDVEKERWNNYQDKMRRLRTGMGVEEATHILGHQLRTLIAGSTSHGERVTYEWELLGGYKVTCTFLNGLLEKHKGSI